MREVIAVDQASNETAETTRRRGRKRRKFTKTQERLLSYLQEEASPHGEVCCTKQQLADRMGRNVKTIDRGIADLKRRGYVSVEMRFGEDGGQIPSAYRVVRAPDSPT